MKSFSDVKYKLYKFCKRRRGCSTAQCIANEMERIMRDHRDKLAGTNQEGDAEFFRNKIEETKNPDTSGLPSDGSKGQKKASAKNKILTYQWILGEVSTEYIKQRIRLWLRVYRPNLFVGAELSEIDSDSSPNKSERVEAKNLISGQTEESLLEYFDDKYGFEVDDSARVSPHATVLNKDEVLEEAKSEEAEA